MESTLKAFENPKSFAYHKKIHFLTKANRNKREALFCLWASIVLSLSVPLFITLGTNEMWSKIIPSILTVLSAIMSSWLQLRKPQKLWSMYRDGQRLIENEMVKHEFSIGEYNAVTNPDGLLAERVAAISLDVHKEWTSVVPAPESLPSLEK
ncbi:DUF4231 domain-containing protein [Hymenobacter defluvii]|uniref:DUF4231 domain-containing protein n=1 Tax=Hymenobacter defluvii TaxID=2054411 RepID=A0ABS3TIC2_9BACT|nr:DUF4231 domain-containing protein [Hymenobacter defluvii]MBO3273382.1 DUF4231 domain-containing protein [Hymenobacter defluvii]